MKDFFSDLSENLSNRIYEKTIIFSGKVNRFDGKLEKLPGKPYKIINSLEKIEKILKN